MTEQVNVQDAKTHLSRPIARVEQGEEIVIARAVHPIAKLVAVQPVASRQLGFISDLDTPESFFEPLTEANIALWEGK